MLIGKGFDEIDKFTLEALVEASVSESVFLEFKRDRYGGSDGEKKELLKDVSAFANTLGGTLVIGIAEKEGTASGLTPLATLDVDAELLRLEQICRAGIEPTIVGLRMKSVPVDEGHVIVLEVPRSFSPPHRVIFKNSNRYFARNSSGVHELSLEELRLLFGERRSIEERVKSFVDGRFARIRNNDGVLPMPVGEGAMALHLVPLTDFGAERRLSLEKVEAAGIALQPIGSTGYSWRLNLDGKCWYRGGPECHGYTQLFRDGSIEATKARAVGTVDSKRYLPGLKLAKGYARTCPDT